MEAPGDDTGRVGVSDFMGVGEWDAEEPTDPTEPTDAMEAICRRGRRRGVSEFCYLFCV